MAEFKKLSAVEMVETVSDSATVLIEEDGVIKKAPKTVVGGTSNGGENVFEDIKIFVWAGDEPRIEYSGGVVPLWDDDLYWYFSDEPAGAKLVDELNDTNRHFRFIIHEGSMLGTKSVCYYYSYETFAAPGFKLIRSPSNMVFTREEL